ncbi:MAG: type secretion system secreted protein VgrG [Desulfovibrionales bacterium]|nr:type secretion system secreted protein VgrG [Desulfovibrionales bacterium]
MRKVTYAFSCKTPAPHPLEVLKIHGCEEVDGCFEFRITARASVQGFDPDAFLGSGARLTMESLGESVVKAGLLDHVKILTATSKFVYVEFLLAPALRRLAYARNSRTFVGRTMEGALKRVLEEGGVHGGGYEFRLAAPDAVRSYLCQYDESDLDFFKRRLEYEGWSYFFEFDEHGDKVVVTDALGARRDLSGRAAGLDLPFAPTGRRHDASEHAVQRISHQRRVAPSTVRIRDWFYERPESPLEGKADVSSRGAGQRYLFGDGPHAPGELERQAKILAEKHQGAGDVYKGASDSPFLAPGQAFSLHGHPLDSNNARFVPLRVEHWGCSNLTERDRTLGPPEDAGYHNRFTAIREGGAYRPLRRTPVPRVCGGIPGFVESEGETYAQLDEHGRYKVRAGFDDRERSPGKSSAPVRLMTPHAGDGYGMHFPLLGGAEVLLAHEQGNPDRPFILGVLPNALAKGPLDNKTSTQARLQTPGGNKLRFEDKEGRSGLLLYSPMGGAGLSLGARPDTLVDPGEGSNFNGSGSSSSPAAAQNTPEEKTAASSDGLGFLDQTTVDDGDVVRDRLKPHDPYRLKSPKIEKSKEGDGKYYGDGINLFTAPGNLLKIEAKHSASVLLGTSYDCHLGLVSRCNASVIETLVEGRMLDAKLSLAKSFNGNKLYTSVADKIYTGSKKFVTGSTNSLYKKMKSFIGVDTASRLDAQRLIDSEQALLDELAEAEGEGNELINKEKNLENEVNEMTGNKDEAVDDEKEILNEKNDMSGEENDAEDEDTLIANELNRSYGQKDEVGDEEIAILTEEDEIKEFEERQFVNEETI